MRALKAMCFNRPVLTSATAFWLVFYIADCVITKDIQIAGAYTQTCFLAREMFTTPSPYPCILGSEATL